MKANISVNIANWSKPITLLYPHLPAWHFCKRFCASSFCSSLAGLRTIAAWLFLSTDKPSPVLISFFSNKIIGSPSKRFKFFPVLKKLPSTEKHHRDGFSQYWGAFSVLVHYFAGSRCTILSWWKWQLIVILAPQYWKGFFQYWKGFPVLKTLSSTETCNPPLPSEGRVGRQTAHPLKALGCAHCLPNRPSEGLGRLQFSCYAGWFFIWRFQYW